VHIDNFSILMLNCQDKAEQPFLLMFVGFGIDEAEDKPNQVSVSVTYFGNEFESMNERAHGEWTDEASKTH
jgi:hypothetical protein